MPACGSCGGVQKPDVVFFGENVPRHQVAAAQAALEEADAMLVVGSSLMVYSGYRLCEHAHGMGKPIVVYTGTTTNNRRPWLRYHATRVAVTEEQLREAISDVIGAR